MIDTWVPDEDAISVRDDASVSLVRERVRARGAGLPPTMVANLVLVASELAHNQLHHARSGLMAVRPIERDGVAGLEIVAGDQGPGIADPASAFAGLGKSNTGLGVGLASVRKLAEEVDVHVRLEEGTCIWARAFAARVIRRREVGIYGRPHPDEDVSGDVASFVRSPDKLTMAVADGLGHGLGAHAAAIAAIRIFAKEQRASGETILASCHAALTSTRGAVMGIAEIDERSRHIHMSGAGNITVSLSSPGQSHRFEGSSFVLGLRRPAHRISVEDAVLRPGAAVVMFSDGLVTRASFDAHPELSHLPSIEKAQELVRLYGRQDDDVTVAVAS